MFKIFAHLIFVMFDDSENFLTAKRSGIVFVVHVHVCVEVAVLGDGFAIVALSFQTQPLTRWSTLLSGRWSW